MLQYAWVLEVRPEYEDEYVRRHHEIWPEMIEALRSGSTSVRTRTRTGSPRRLVAWWGVGSLKMN